MPTIGVEFLTQEINLPGLPPMKASIWHFWQRKIPMHHYGALS